MPPYVVQQILMELSCPIPLRCCRNYVRLTVRLMVRARESSLHTRTYLQHIIGFAFPEAVLKKLQKTIPYRTVYSQHQTTTV